MGVLRDRFARSSKYLNRLEPPGTVRPLIYNRSLKQSNYAEGTGTKNWTQLFQAFAEALDWVLSLASDLARNYPAEVATVERVRTFIHRRIAGDPAHIRADDLLFALGLIGGALELYRSTEPAPRVHARTLRAKPRPARQSPLRVNHRGARAAADGKSPIQHSLFAH